MKKAKRKYKKRKSKKGKKWTEAYYQTQHNKLNGKVKMWTDYYNSECKKTKELKHKLRNRNYQISILILLSLGMLLILPNLGKNVDEAKFCLDKLDKHFPEYKFTRAEAQTHIEGYYVCEGYYTDGKNVVRDGLENLEKEVEKSKKFKLLNKDDIDYMMSDDLPNTLVGFGVVLFIALIIVMWYWGTEVHDR